MNAPDPEHLKEIMFRLSGIFQAAADDAAGDVKPLLSSLSENFNEVAQQMEMLDLDDPNSGIALLMALGPVMQDMQSTFTKIERLAKQDPAAADTLQDLQGKVHGVLEDLMGGGVPGGFAPPPPPPRNPPFVPKRPKLKSPAPKKPRDGNHDL